MSDANYVSTSPPPDEETPTWWLVGLENYVISEPPTWP